jgi:hypothetical protein
MSHESLVRTLRLSTDLSLMITSLFEIVAVCCSALSSPGRQARPQLQRSPLLGHQQRTSPGVILVCGEQVPDEDGEFPRGGDRGNLLATPTADAQEECAQPAGRASSR